MQGIWCWYNKANVGATCSGIKLYNWIKTWAM
jgi:hypothetical protein